MTFTENSGKKINKPENPKQFSQKHGVLANTLACEAPATFVMPYTAKDSFV